MRGSVLSQIWKSLLVNTLLTVVVTLTHGALLHHKIILATIPFALMGLPLALGHETEEPFGTSANDLPLEAICRGIEISLRESLGEQDLPSPCQPVHCQLS
jgi:predicted membrane chloride channel (bestrophin family)